MYGGEMKHVLTAAFIASFAVGVAASQQPATSGQQPATPADRPATQGERPTTPGQPPATRAETPTTTQAAKTMITGCIQAAPPAAAGAGGAPAAAATSKFDLANAKVVSGGPVGTAGAAATAMRYRLEGDEKTISPHVNHQVEITGTITPATAGTAGATAATPMLKVESVKMVAATCPTAGSGATPNP
jgi:hypothetical protein